MVETRRKLDAKHIIMDKGLFITGIVFLGLSVIFFIAMANSPRASGELIGSMVFALICLILGLAIFFGSFNAPWCHCAKCCRNPSENGLYCNGHYISISSGIEYERHYHYDAHGHKTGYTEVPKK